jgi:hypothetical protein
MKTNTAKIVNHKLDPDNLPPLTENQKKELEALASMPNSEIDSSDILQITDEQSKSAFHYHPVKQ